MRGSRTSPGLLGHEEEGSGKMQQLGPQATELTLGLQGCLSQKHCGLWTKPLSPRASSG